MSLQKKSWSVSALAVEFNIDRRTCAKRLDWAGIQPIHQVNGAPRYRLADAVNALPLREPETRAASAEDSRFSVEAFAVRCVFTQADPAARFLIRHTRLSPEQVLDLIPELWAAFEEQAGAVLNEPEILKNLPLGLDDENRGALLNLLRAERKRSSCH